MLNSCFEVVNVLKYITEQSNVLTAVNSERLLDLKTNWQFYKIHKPPFNEFYYYNTNVSISFKHKLAFSNLVQTSDNTNNV